MRKIIILAILLSVTWPIVNLYCSQSDVKVSVMVLGTVPKNPAPDQLVRMIVRVTNDGPDNIPAGSEIYLKYSTYGDGSQSSGTHAQKSEIKTGESIELKTGGHTLMAGNYIFAIEELTVSNEQGRTIIAQLINPTSYKFKIGSGSYKSVSTVSSPVLKEISAINPEIMKINAEADNEIVRGNNDFNIKTSIVNTGKTFMTFPDSGLRWDTNSAYVKISKQDRAYTGKLIKLDPGETYQDTVTLFVTNTAEPGPIKFNIKFIPSLAMSAPITILYIPATATTTEIKDFFSYFNRCADENLLKVKEGMMIEDVRAMVGGTKYKPYYIPRSIDFIPFSFCLDSMPANEVGFSNRPEGINDFFISENNVMQVKYLNNGKVKGSTIWPIEKLRIKTTGGVFDVRIK